MQGSGWYLLYKYSLYCLKFCCRGSKGVWELNLNDTVKLADPENRTLEQKYDSMLYTTGVMTV